MENISYFKIGLFVICAIVIGALLALEPGDTITERARWEAHLAMVMVGAAACGSLTTVIWNN